MPAELEASEKRADRLPYLRPGASDCRDRDFIRPWSGFLCGEQGVLYFMVDAEGSDRRAGWCSSGIAIGMSSWQAVFCSRVRIRRAGFSSGRV